MSVEGVLKGGIEPLLERMFDVVFEEVPLAADECWSTKGPITKLRVHHKSRVHSNALSHRRGTWEICTWTSSPTPGSAAPPPCTPSRDAA